MHPKEDINVTRAAHHTVSLWVVRAASTGDYLYRWAFFNSNTRPLNLRPYAIRLSREEPLMTVIRPSTALHENFP